MDECFFTKLPQEPQWPTKDAKAKQVAKATKTTQAGGGQETKKTQIKQKILDKLFSRINSSNIISSYEKSLALAR